MKPVLLALTFLSEEHRAQMAEVFEVVYAPDTAQAAAAIAEHGPRVRVALTIGAIGLSPAQIDALPALTLICVLGAGYENVAVDHAKARGIVVAGFLPRVSRSSAVTPAISAAFCSALAPSRVILILT